MTAPFLEIRGLHVDTRDGRPLFRDLSLSVGCDRVAVIGRNGAGKSTLLRILAGEGAGEGAAERGSRVATVEPVLVRQELDPHEVERAARGLQQRSLADRGGSRMLAQELARAGLPPLSRLIGAHPSRGEARKLLLLAAKLSEPELLLLDEPTDDLDEAGLAWLDRWLRAWDRGAIVVSHHRGLLRGFEQFFVVAESGCRHVPGTFDALERRLEAENAARERQYVRDLNVLAEREQHHERVTRRRQRKKNVGRLHELRRCTSRCRLNDKRSYAQESQARAAKIREDRIAAVRGWAKAARRALAVTLPLELPSPTLAEADGRDVATLDGVGVRVDERALFSGIDLRVGRERIAITGPNGAGKTTLLRVISGELSPTTGHASRRAGRIGTIAQGASNWMLDDSLLSLLLAHDERASVDALAARVVEHKFPLALAERPLRSLSPGERVRAALIGLFQRAPTVELLVLDEPSHSLDFVGVAALERALRAWPGGLIVASHDSELLEAIGIERTVALDGSGGHRIEGA